jgi:hypothetical protein
MGSVSGYIYQRSLGHKVEVHNIIPRRCGALDLPKLSTYQVSVVKRVFQKPLSLI